MSRPTGVVLDTNDVVRAWLCPHKVYETDALLVSSTTESNGDSAMAIPATFSTKWNGELADGFAFVEMGVQRSFEVTNAWCDRLVGFEESGCSCECCVDYVLSLGDGSLGGIGSGKPGEGKRGIRY